MSMLTQAIGRVLAGRYRVEWVLGTGASAHVFAAHDVELRRRVAIKLLHPALAADGAFLRRFRAEAQAAAALTHPRVLSVFDWGEDTSGPFLVLEFLGGGSLRDLLDDGRTLSVPQAVAIGTQAAEGLAYAHGRGFVHRDVKPANLLFDDEGRLQVADFGLARALAEAAFTEPSGAALGTARYAAPEQAQGHLVDGHADVYALALVLYEAVTGTVPFTADTTIGTLMARVGAPLPHPEALGPLGALLVDAAAPDAAHRLGAKALVARLSDLGARLPAPEPLALRGPLGPGADTRGSPFSNTGPWFSSIDRTEHGTAPLVAPVPGTPAGRVGRGSGADADTQALGLASAVGVTAGTEADHPTQPAAPFVDDSESEAPPWVRAERMLRSRRPLPKALLIALAAGVVLGGGALAVTQTGLLVPSHPVPQLAKLTRAQAEAKLRADHFALEVIAHRHSTTVASGDVVQEIPAPGTSLKEGSNVSVVLSSGPPPVAVPSLSSVTSGGCSAVAAALAVVQLRPDCIYQNSTQVPQGGVIDWSPKNKAPEFSAVQVTISQGPVMETIPSLTGLTCATATSTLQAIDLTAKCVDVYTATGTPNGQVIPGGWQPSASAPQGSVVTVSISQGPPPVQVPQVGPREKVPAALAALLAAGFTPGQVYGPVQGTVFATNPSYPATAPQGTTVDIYTR